MQRVFAVHCRSGAAQNSGRREVTFRQIAPLGTEIVDELELPRATPSFEASLSRPRLGDRRVFLKIDQPDNSVFSGEARHRLRSVLKHPAMQIARHADVESAIAAICQN